MEVKKDISLTKGEKEVIGCVVDHYLETGEAISSLQIKKKYKLRSSPSTIRNYLHKLMRQGFLSQKHISSGRFPTEKGISYYVNNLFVLADISKSIVDKVIQEYDRIEGTIDQIVDNVSVLLSNYTHTACLATLPDTRSVKIRSAKIVRLAPRRYLVILVFEGGLTDKTFIKLDRDISSQEITFINNYLNRIMEGLSLDQVKKLFFNRTEYLKKEYSVFMENILKLSSKVFESEGSPNLLVNGKLTFRESLDLSDPEVSRNLLEIFENRELIKKLLEKVDSLEEIKVFVGEYNEMPRGCTLIASSYGNSYQRGRLGIFGPVRMNYSQLIPLVKCTAKYLSMVLNQGGKT